jgi:hypothetical protein
MSKNSKLFIAGVCVFLFGICGAVPTHSKTSIISLDMAGRIVVGDEALYGCMECPWTDPSCDGYYCKDGPGSGQCQAQDDYFMQEDAYCNSSDDEDDTCYLWDSNPCYDRTVCEKSSAYDCDCTMCMYCRAFHIDCSTNTIDSYDTCSDGP